MMNKENEMQQYQQYLWFCHKEKKTGVFSHILVFADVIYAHYYLKTAVVMRPATELF